jgi:hypothetical protein
LSERGRRKVRVDYVVFWLRKSASGSVDRPAGGREKVVDVRFRPRDDVRRSIDQRISVYLYDDHTVYDLWPSRSLEPS